MERAWTTLGGIGALVALGFGVGLVAACGPREPPAPPDPFTACTLRCGQDCVEHQSEASLACKQGCANGCRWLQRPSWQSDDGGSQVRFGVDGSTLDLLR